MEYRITVSATDALGTRGTEHEVLVRSGPELGSQPSTTLQVLGPETTRPDTELRAEAILLSCDPKLQPSARIEASFLFFSINHSEFLFQKFEICKF